MSEYILVSDKDSKVIYSTSQQLDAIRMIRVVWAAGGEATLFKAVDVSEDEGE